MHPHGVLAAGDQGRALVDHRVAQAPRLLVTIASVAQKGAGQPLRERVTCSVWSMVAIVLLPLGQLPPITGAIIVTGAGASAELTSTRTPAAIASRTCAALVNGCTARSTLPGTASTSRTSVQAPV
jgi:hypothetical protein